MTNYPLHKNTFTATKIWAFIIGAVISYGAYQVGDYDSQIKWLLLCIAFALGVIILELWDSFKVSELQQKKTHDLLELRLAEITRELNTVTTQIEHIRRVD